MPLNISSPNAFVASCIKDGLTSTQQMVEAAQEQLSNCNECLKQDLLSLEQHRSQKEQIESILVNFGQSPRKRKSKILPSSVEKSPDSDFLDANSYEICLLIWEFIEDLEEESFLATDLQKFVSEFEVNDLPVSEKNKICIYLIKMLQENSFIKSVQQVPLTLIKGQRWLELKETIHTYSK